MTKDRRAPYRTSQELLPPAALHGPLDELDRLIVATLRRDPQASNRSMAREGHVSEPTVAARIRSLSARRLIHLTAQRDIVAQGTPIVAHADVTVEGREAEAVAREIAALDEVSSVVTIRDACQVIAQIHARDAAHLLSVVEGAFGRIPGIVRVETNVSLEILKYRPDVAILAGS